MTSTRPNFLIIGAARSGTTAAARFLSSHPDIFLTTPKEPHFFALANSTPHFAGPGDDEMINRVAVTDPAEYGALYAKADGARFCGDGSVSTMFVGEAAVENIARYASPDVRLLALIRDPVDRAWSSFLYLRARGYETCERFTDALAMEPERARDNWHHMWRYRELGYYHHQLEPFRTAFGRDRIHVVLHDELQNNPAQAMAGILEFLGAAPHVFDTSAEINRSGEPRSKLLHRSMLQLRSSEPVKRAVKTLTSQRVRERIRAANLDHPTLTTDDAEPLRGEYETDLELLERDYGVDVSHWKGTK